MLRRGITSPSITPRHSRANSAELLQAALEAASAPWRARVAYGEALDNLAVAYKPMPFTRGPLLLALHACLVRSSRSSL